MAKNKASFEPPKLDPLLRMFDQIPKGLEGKGGPADAGVQAAARVAVKAVAAEAPRSAATGSRDKQSDKSKAAWPETLHTTIRHKMVYYPRPVAIIGPKFPEGNVAHFLQTKRRRHVLWGKASWVRGFRLARNWLIKAMDSSKGRQDTALRRELRRGLDRIMKAK